MKKSLWLIFGGLLLIGFASVAGISPFMGIAMLASGGVVFLYKSLIGVHDGNQDQTWLEEFSRCKYKFSGEGTGIALDEVENKIHLRRDDYSKSYAFNDVRSWNTNLQTGGSHIYGGGQVFHALAVGSANKKQEKSNSENTGLFIKVKDINTPEWRIRFSSNESVEKAEQTRWMEILTQVLNENSAEQGSQGARLQKADDAAIKPFRFCVGCGTKNMRSALFCEDCGERITTV